MSVPPDIMSCSVNLVPMARSADRARGRRRTAWIITCSIAVLLLGTGWGVQHLTAAALERVSNAVNELEVQRTEVQRRVMIADSRRGELLDKLRTIAAARKPQPWARRLTDLMRDAPDGIHLTALDVSPAGHTAARPTTNRPGQQYPNGAGAPTELSVRLSGYAPDHGVLLQLVNTLQALPDWQRVELVRAIQEPLGGGLAIAFDLDCTTLEVSP